uniref:RRM domain-containing protein n=1 Tax=Araucaria cunninghamii TaxID=56994 RepID=A0A0D6R389_ARACU
MPGNQVCTVFIGNLDEKVDERVLYEILIQAGPVIDLHILRDRETNRHKGYAFAEYEREDIAQYAVKLFSGLVVLNNRMLRFAISGQDKQEKPSPSQNAVNYSTFSTPSQHSPPVFGRQMLPPSPYTPAERTTGHSPNFSVSNFTPNHSPAYNNPGAIKNGYNMNSPAAIKNGHNMEKISHHSQSYNYNSKRGEAKRYDSCLSSSHHTGYRSSVQGSGYACAHPSF